ncbi:MAG TPA: hypothetical protein VHR45_06715 [Thermoanaerobaculia bacterium]|nr:hypothetical protein [Thermoanaerobaculia bacterium]
MDSRFLLICVGLFAALWAIFNWRRALQLAMVLIVVEGAIRKWLFPGAQDLVYLGKDVILLGTYAGFIRQRASLRYRPPPLVVLYSALGAGAAFGLLQIFNPQLPNLLVGAFGFKAYFLYVPLLFVVPAAYQSDRELVRFLRRYIVLSIPVGILAAAQFLSPSSSLLNTYARGETGSSYISTFGSSEFVRVTGTFAYITGYASYLVAMSILVLAYLAAAQWRLRRSVVIYAALGMTLLGMLMAGSRGPVLMLALLFPVYWWLAVIRGGQGAATFARLLVGLTAIGVLVGSVGGDAITAFRGRAAGTEDIAARIIAPFTTPFQIMQAAGPIGFGIGATHSTASAVTPGIVPYSWLHGVVVEVESGRVMIELGPLGFFLVYFVRIYLIGFALRQVLALRSTFHRAVATASLLFFLAQLPGSIVFDITSDFYYWFFAGLLLLVMRLDRLAVPAASRAVAAPAAKQPRGRTFPTPVGVRSMGSGRSAGSRTGPMESPHPR